MDIWPYTPTETLLFTCPEVTTDEVPWEGPFEGLIDPSPEDLSATDLEFAAALFAAAADKTGMITMDMVVYLNSILGINDVLVEKDETPDYFDFSTLGTYSRDLVVGLRGSEGTPGQVRVLVEQETPGTWDDTGDVPILELPFDELGVDSDNGFPTDEAAAFDILGFTQMADDDLRVIDFIHTYQIPGFR